MKYKYFSIDDVFYHSRGKRLIRLNQVDGDIAYVSSTKFNNGVDNYIKKDGKNYRMQVKYL